MPPVLYQIPASPPCRAVFMLLEIINLEVERKLVNTLAGEQFKPEFVEKNPQHTIPVLEDGDFTLADSHAILIYLVSKYGAEHRAELFPVDLRTRALVEQMLFFNNSTLFPRMMAAGKMILQKSTNPTEEQLAAIEEGYGFLEKYLERSKFVAADHLTIADLACVATISTTEMLVPVSDKFVKIHEWHEQLQKYDWYQKANLPGLEMIKTVMSSKQPQ